jgi:1-deoxyxylulose-5-phosphate synthase
MNTIPLKRREIEQNLFPYCQQNHITVIAYTPLANGSLTVHSSSQEEQRRGPLHRAAGRLLGREPERQRLQEVADEVGKTPAQVALNWCISRPNVVVIPKSNSMSRVEENCGASGWRLSEDQLRRLDEAFPV